MSIEFEKSDSKELQSLMESLGIEVLSAEVYVTDVERIKRQPDVGIFTDCPGDWSYIIEELIGFTVDENEVKIELTDKLFEVLSKVCDDKYYDKFYEQAADSLFCEG